MDFTDLFYNKIREQQQRRAEEARQIDSVETQKRNLLAKPQDIDHAVATMADALSPSASMKRPRGESFGVDSVEASKSENDPTRGFGVGLKQAYTSALLDPNNRGVSAGQLLHKLAYQGAYGKGEDGQSLMDRAFQYSNTERSRLWGGDAVKELPGEQEWVADQKLRRQEEQKRESWLPSASDIATGVGTMALGGAVTGAIGGGLAGVGASALANGLLGFAMGGPIGAAAGTVMGGVAGFFGGEATGALAGTVTGALLGLGSEFVAKPIKNMIHKTDWYNGMISSNSVVDRLKASIGTDMLAYTLGGMATSAGMKGVVGGLKGLGNKLTEGLEGQTGMNLGQEVYNNKPISGMTGLPLTEEEMKFNAFKQKFQDVVATPAIEYKPKPGDPYRYYDSLGREQTVQPSAGESLYDDLIGKQSNLTAVGKEELRKQIGYTTGLNGQKLIPWSAMMSQDTENAVGNFIPELPRLLEAGKGYEWPGMKNLGRAERKGASAPLPKAEEPQRLIGFNDMAGEEDFSSFARYASGKSYSGPPVPGEPFNYKAAENEAFDTFAKWARNKIYTEGRNNLAAANVEEANTARLQALAKIKENPSAATILQEQPKVAKTPKEVKGSSVVQMSQELDDIGMKEAGLEPIVSGENISQQPGQLPERIARAKERQDFSKIASEDVNGELRSQIAKTSEESFKTTTVPLEQEKAVPIDLPTSEPTTGDKAKAVATVENFANGEDSVMHSTFPDTKPVAEENPLIRDYLKSTEVEAGRPINTKEERTAFLREQAEQRVKNRKEVLEDNTPITQKEIDREHKLLLRDETGNFRAWARSTGRTSELTKDMTSSKYKVLAGMAAMLPAGLALSTLYDEMSGKTADAGMLGSMLKGATAEMGKIAEESLAKHLISKSVEVGQTVMRPENWQVGIMRMPEEILKLVKYNIRSDKGTGTQYSLMSPFQVIESLLKTGTGKMINPANHEASFFTAGGRNSEQAMKVTSNILAEGKIQTSANKVRKAMEPLVPFASKAAKEEFLVDELKRGEKRILELSKTVDKNDPAAVAADIAKEKEILARRREEYDAVKGSIDVFHKKWADVAKPLAEEEASVRLALALEDPTRSLYPWLPKLSRDEEVAAGKLRVLLDQYQARLKERKLPTRDNYLPHSPHPEMRKVFEQEFADVLGGAPYKEFYSRTQSSRPLLPDISYTMNHYIYDIEPRIQNYDMWTKSGWALVKNLPEIQANPGLKRSFDQLYEGGRPAERTWGNIAAQRYGEFEAMNKLFLNPSAGLKHIIKMIGDVASVGPKVWAKSLPDTTGYVFRKFLDKSFGMNGTTVREALAKVGVKSERFNRNIIDDYMDSAIISSNMRRFMADQGIEDQSQLIGTLSNAWKGLQTLGSTWISFAELIDRGTSVSSALQMAAKKGMTVEQAMYGTYDLILKNNFLYSQFNPAWLNNPKIRAFFMFQSTPFHILERRLATAQRSIQNVNQMSKEVLNVLKQPGGREKVLEDLKNLKAYMREGQSELKANLFADTIKHETDFFGTPVVRQMAMEMLAIGASTYGMGLAGVSLFDHFMHLPFISVTDKGTAAVNINPLLKSTVEGYHAWKTREDNEDFLLGAVMKKWLGPYGPLPRPLEKAIRLSENDIPEIYKKGGGSAYLKYLFGVPGKE